MFLYWKKRGAYELETLPSSLAELGAERYSWSSSLDVIHDLVGKNCVFWVAGDGRGGWGGGGGREDGVGGGL